MTTNIEIPFINFERLATAYQRANRNFRDGDRRCALVGIRAARARDPKLMKGLERAIEVVDAKNDAVRGQTQRALGVSYADSFPALEVGIFREAYKAADQGRPLEQLMVIYGCVAELAGLF